MSKAYKSALTLQIEYLQFWLLLENNQNLVIEIIFKDISWNLYVHPFL